MNELYGVFVIVSTGVVGGVQFIGPYSKEVAETTAGKLKDIYDINSATVLPWPDGEKLA